MFTEKEFMDMVNEQVKKEIDSHRSIVETAMNFHKQYCDHPQDENCEADFMKAFTRIFDHHYEKELARTVLETITNRFLAN